MGCDIHMVLERKWTNSEGTVKWVGKEFSYFSDRALDFTYEKYWEDDGTTPRKHSRPKYVTYLITRRNYGFFNALCGVRGDGSEFGYTGRGLPDDASDMSEMVLSEDDLDLHSHSWLSIRELVPCLVVHWGRDGKKPEEYVFERMADPDGNLYLAAELVDENINAENVHEWRLVFAFDN